MKQSDALAVGDILKAMIDSGGNSGEFDRQKAAYLWSEIAGPTLTRATTRRFMSGDELHVFISSAALKSELTFMAAGLADKINEALGRRVVKKIIVH